MVREEWVDKAIKMSLEDFEIIYDTFVTPNFVEVSGNNGGDLIRIRYYKNGSKGEK